MAKSFHAISPDHPCITIKKKEQKESRGRSVPSSDTKVFLEDKDKSVRPVTHEWTSSVIYTKTRRAKAVRGGLL